VANNLLTTSTLEAYEGSGQALKSSIKGKVKKKHFTAGVAVSSFTA
jgi:tRNA(Met) C34 N-acetyltransferase TmcA